MNTTKTLAVLVGLVIIGFGVSLLWPNQEVTPTPVDTSSSQAQVQDQIVPTNSVIGKISTYTSATGLIFSVPDAVPNYNPKCGTKDEAISYMVSEGPNAVYLYPTYYYDYENQVCSKKLPDALHGEYMVRDIAVVSAITDKEIVAAVNSYYKIDCIKAVEIKPSSFAGTSNVTLVPYDDTDDICIGGATIVRWSEKLGKLAILALGQDWALYEQAIAESLHF